MARRNYKRRRRSYENDALVTPRRLFVFGGGAVVLLLAAWFMLGGTGSAACSYPEDPGCLAPPPVEVQPVASVMMVDMAMPSSVRLANELMGSARAGDSITLVDRTGNKIYTGSAPVRPEELSAWKASASKLLPLILSEPAEQSCAQSSGWALTTVRTISRGLIAKPEGTPKLLLLPGDASMNNREGVGMNAGELAGITVVVAPYTLACGDLEGINFWLGKGTPDAIETVPSLDPEGALTALIAEARLNAAKVLAIPSESSPAQVQACVPSLVLALGPTTSLAKSDIEHFASVYVQNLVDRNSTGPTAFDVLVLRTGASGQSARLSVPPLPVDLKDHGRVHESGIRDAAADKAKEDLKAFTLPGEGTGAGRGSSVAASTIDAFLAEKSHGMPRCAYLVLDAGANTLASLRNAPRAIFLVGQGLPTAAHHLYVSDADDAIDLIIQEETR